MTLIDGGLRAFLPIHCRSRLLGNAADTGCAKLKPPTSMARGPPKRGPSLTYPWSSPLSPKRILVPPSQLCTPISPARYVPSAANTSNRLPLLQLAEVRNSNSSPSYAWLGQSFVNVCTFPWESPFALPAPLFLSCRKDKTKRVPGHETQHSQHLPSRSHLQRHRLSP